MDRRREPRCHFDQPVWITALSRHESGLSGTAVDLSGKGMRVRTKSAIAPDTPVKVETAESLYLAEVCYCLPEGDGFLIGLAVDQVLRGLPDLARLWNRLAQDEVRPVPSAVHS